MFVPGGNGNGPRNGPHGLTFTPAQVLVLGFAGLIALGTFLLSLPQASATGKSIGVVNALFTATSAACVTGLVVLDTAKDFSLFGQLVILGLIQVGGLGIMTMSTLVALLLGKKISLRERLIMQEALGGFSIAGLVRLTRIILFFTLIIESVGALFLFVRWSFDYPLGRAAYLGLFHAVSGFNNAGFDLFSISFAGYVEDLTVNLVIMSLVVIGGLGFTVIADLYEHRFGKRRLSFHTRMVLRVTVVLLALGAVAVFASEFNNPDTLGPLSMRGKILASLFHSVMPRTAGFNTLPTGKLTQLTLLVTLMLMYVGASPGSTGGGIKTTTFAAILLGVRATITGQKEVITLERRIDREIIDRALAIAFVALALVIGVTGTLLVTEKAMTFLQVFFESMSAFGTVGLSTGITPSLSTAGRLVIAFTMYAGRVGPLTLAIALAHRNRTQTTVRYPEERLIVG